MCGLCGVFGGEHHWTAAGQPENAAPDVNRRRIERMRRVTLVNSLLAPRRVSLQDWQGVSYLLSSPTGGSELVDSLGGIWEAVERLTGRPFDPLEMADD